MRIPKEADFLDDFIVLGEVNTDASVTAVKARNKNASLLLRYTRVCPFIWREKLFKCLYCAVGCVDIDALQSHNDSEHGTVAPSAIKTALRVQINVNTTNMACKICDHAALDLNGLKQHLLDVHKKGIDLNANDVVPFKITSKKCVCVLCGKGFDEFNELFDHMNVHLDNRTAKIDDMRKSIMKDLVKSRKKNAMTLIQYTNICPFRWMKNFFICFYCDKKYLDAAVLQHHNTLEHHFPSVADIKSAMSKLKRHELVKVNTISVSCKLCDDVCADLDGLKLHLANAHEKSTDPNTTNELLPFKIWKDHYGCVLCDETCDEFKTLNHHMNVHFQNFICEQCGAGFITPERLRTHAFSHESGAVGCEACEKVFRSVNAKNEHFANVHRQVKRHRCPHCAEAFRNYFQRNKHIAHVHGLKLKEFKCQLCPKVFTSSGKLGVHVRTVHLKMKRHACNLCEWKFYSRSELKEHMVRHGGERKFVCNVCKKAYARKYTLREHMRIHENDRRFVCSYCGASFVQKCSLNHHVKVNHPSVDIDYPAIASA